MLDQNDKTYFDLAGALLYAPCIGDCGFTQLLLPTYPFVKANNLILNINETFLSYLEQMSLDCGYTEVKFSFIIADPSADYPTFPTVHGRVYTVPASWTPTSLARF